MRKRSKEMKARQDKGMAGFSKSVWKDHSYQSDSEFLVLTHRPVHRFVDMKRRRTKSKGIINKKSHAIHNRIVMGNYNGLMKELTFGAGEDAVQNLRNSIQGNNINIY